MLAGSLTSKPSAGAPMRSANTASVMRVRAAGAIAFAVTPKLARGASAYHLIQPQLAAIAVSVISIAWGLHRQMDASTVTNACWALFNISMLAGVVRAAAGRRRPASIPVSARGTT